MQHPHRRTQRHSGSLSSCRPARCRRIGLGGSAPGQFEGGLPLDAVGDDVQEPLPVGHVVRVAGLDRFPGVPGRVGCRKPERAGKPGPAVGAVVCEGLAGPLAGDQDSPSGVAEVFAAVGFAFAASTASDRHRQPPADLKLARAFDSRATHENTLVMRRSLVSDEDLGAGAPTALRGTLLKSAEAYH